jgi:hypothetical protein
VRRSLAVVDVVGGGGDACVIGDGWTVSMQAAVNADAGRARRRWRQVSGQLARADMRGSYELVRLVDMDGANATSKRRVGHLPARRGRHGDTWCMVARRRLNDEQGVGRVIGRQGGNRPQLQRQPGRRAFQGPGGGLG